MVRVGPYTFKFAETAEELDQVHRLNFQTFVQEIPQHADPGKNGRLVDKFHEKNRYLICVRDGRVVGMLAAHCEPPFSIADRLPDPVVLTQKGVRPVEIRLLAVDPGERDTTVLTALVLFLFHCARGWDATHFVISAVVEQRAMYDHLGFVPFGPPVGTGRASYQPMWASLGQVQDSMGHTMHLLEKRAMRERFPGRTGGNLYTTALGRSATAESAAVCLLPGPVAIADAVHDAFREPLVYHRADEFILLFERARARLSDLVGGKPAALFVGSGTLANDVVAATLAAEPKKEAGLVLVNGEFGDRIRRQAARWGLDPRVLSWDWGKPWDLAAVESTLAQLTPGGWVWGVHHETSTGVLNDLPGLVRLAKKFGHRVCADCVSSIGTVDVNLADVHLATGASGKAIGSYAGVAVVFADPASLALQPDSVPSYLDVAATLATHGPRFTFPSPLIRALDVALDAFATPEKRAARFRQLADVGGYVRSKLIAAGFEPLAPAAVANPSIVTFAPPTDMTAAQFVETCRTWGFQVAGQSGYLADRGLVQIAVMGTVTKAQIKPLLDKLAG